MRIFGKILLVILLGGCATGPKQHPGPLTESRYIPTEDFYRISEYFTGREPETDRIFVRSDPEVRGGYYWIFPIGAEMAQNGVGEIQLSVQIPGDPEIRDFVFPCNRPANSGTTLWIGLTGRDWPDPETSPIAWQIQILSPEGATLLERQSYLWQTTPSIQTEETSSS